jgi:signal transduction histidine kinase
VAVVQRTPDGRARDWHLAVPDELVAAIDPGDLAEALGNLTENAARHARHRVAVTAVAEGDVVVVRVADDGPGIPSSRLDEVRRRGVRLAELGRGAGLGLAIVEDVATVWGGSLVLRNEAGCVAELRLLAVLAAGPPRVGS